MGTCSSPGTALKSLCHRLHRCIWVTTCRGQRDRYISGGCAEGGDLSSEPHPAPGLSLRAAGGFPQSPWHALGGLTPSAIPKVPHHGHAHGTGRVHRRLGAVPAEGAASRELVLPQLEIQARPVPGAGQGEADLHPTPGRTLQNGTGTYSQGHAPAVSPPLWAPLGAKAWAGAQPARCRAEFGSQMGGIGVFFWKIHLWQDPRVWSRLVQGWFVLGVQRGGTGGCDGHIKPMWCICRTVWSISASPRQAQRPGDLPLLPHGHRRSGKVSRGGHHQGGHSLCRQDTEVPSLPDKKVGGQFGRVQLHEMIWRRLLRCPSDFHLPKEWWAAPPETLGFN